MVEVAKLTAPLFSLKASGQLAKTLVYMNWKGIEDVRQYVIPANPKTAAQQTQRGYFTNAVDAWHTTGFSTLDLTAWNLLASALKLPASGYNMHMRYYVDAKVAGKTFTELHTCAIASITSSGASVSIKVASDKTGKLYIGTSKTLMPTEFSGSFDTDHYTFTLTGLAASTKYYFYMKNTAAGEEARTGIYTFSTTA